MKPASLLAVTSVLLWSTLPGCATVGSETLETTSQESAASSTKSAEQSRPTSSRPPRSRTAQSRPAESQPRTTRPAATQTASTVDTPADSTTLTGGFVWTNRNRSGDLKAVFTPAGDQRWDVSFYFDFRTEPHVYSGTAEGSLSHGKLSGEVRNENKRRTFTFTGAFEDDTFRGTHAEIRRNKTVDTGTLTLSR